MIIKFMIIKVLIQFNILGTSLFKQKQYNKAIKCYSKAIKLSPSYYEAYISKGLLNQLIFQDLVQNHFTNIQKQLNVMIRQLK